MLSRKRAYVFVDGQNLYHAAKESFGYAVPNYDVGKLARAICDRYKWELVATKFYTGVPSYKASPDWRAFWRARLGAMRKSGIETFSRQLRYSLRKVDGEMIYTGEEKGIDVRIALDVVSAIVEEQCDVAVIFSQDQDFSEVAKEVRRIAQIKERSIEVASAYPYSESYTNKHGIHDTKWIKIDRALYDECLDNRNYFPKKSSRLFPDK